MPLTNDTIIRNLNNNDGYTRAVTKAQQLHDQLVKCSEQALGGPLRRHELTARPMEGIVDELVRQLSVLDELEARELSHHDTGGFNPDSIREIGG